MYAFVEAFLVVGIEMVVWREGTKFVLGNLLTFCVTTRNLAAV